MAGITLKNVSKRQDSFVGVQDFNLEIAERELPVLPGPLYCGKTVTMPLAS